MIKSTFLKLYKNTRYYFIEKTINLFGEIEVSCIYGNVNYKAPTGYRIHLFNSNDLADIFFHRLLDSKFKKGYRYYW